MAQAFVRIIDTSGIGGINIQQCFYTVTFSGADVSSDSATGLQDRIEISMPYDYSVGDLKNAISTAVREKAALLGISITNSKIYIPSYEACDSAGIKSMFSFWIGGV